MHRIDAFLELAVQQGGSDLHLVSGQPPRIRIWGDLQPVRFRELSSHDVLEFLTEFMTPQQRESLESRTAIDFAYDSPHGRFRVTFLQLPGVVNGIVDIQYCGSGQTRPDLSEFHIFTCRLIAADSLHLRGHESHE